jgi:hypothetical protein
MLALSYSRFISEEIKATTAWQSFLAEKTKLTVLTEAIAWKPKQEGLTFAYRRLLAKITRNN